MAEDLFRTHLMAAFDQTCANMTQKFLAVEQFAKFIGSRAKLTLDFAKGLERLNQKGSTIQEINAEETGVEKMWTQIISVETEHAKLQASFANSLQSRVSEQLLFMKQTSESLRKTILQNGQSSIKSLKETLSTLSKTKEKYIQASRELEAAEWQLKNETKKGDFVQRDKKVVKCRQERDDAEAAYKSAVISAIKAQRTHYEKTLPQLLDSLQHVFVQRLTKIQEAFLEYTTSMRNAHDAETSLITGLEDVVGNFKVAGDVEEYVAKSEAFFRLPPEPAFEEFVPTPEGQMPINLQNKHDWSNKLNFVKKLERDFLSRVSFSSEGEGEGSSHTTDFSAGILGLDVPGMMVLQKKVFPKLRVPYVFVFLADALLKQDAQNQEGVFRLTGSLVSIEQQKQKINDGKYSVTSDVHDTSSLFKFFLRSLPSGFIPSSLYEAAINEPPDSNAVFSQIEEPEKSLAGFVIRFLSDYFCKPEVIKNTKMTPENLATVFFPVYIRCPSTDLMEVMKHSEQEKAWFCKCLKTLDVSSFPSLEECIAASRPSQVDGSEFDFNELLTGTESPEPTSAPLSTSGSTQQTWSTASTGTASATETKTPAGSEGPKQGGTTGPSGKGANGWVFSRNARSQQTQQQKVFGRQQSTPQPPSHPLPPTPQQKQPSTNSLQQTDVPIESGGGMIMDDNAIDKLMQEEGSEIVEEEEIVEVTEEVKGDQIETPSKLPQQKQTPPHQEGITNPNPSPPSGQQQGGWARTRPANQRQLPQGQKPLPKPLPQRRGPLPPSKPLPNPP